MASTPAYPKQALLSTGRCSYRQHSDTAPLLVHKRSQRDNAIAGFALRRSAAVPRTALAGRRRGQRRLTTSPRPETSCLFYLVCLRFAPPHPHLTVRSLAFAPGTLHLCTFVPTIRAPHPHHTFARRVVRAVALGPCYTAPLTPRKPSVTGPSPTLRMARLHVLLRQGRSAEDRLGTQSMISRCSTTSASVPMQVAYRTRKPQGTFLLCIFMGTELLCTDNKRR
jgi:hypothetical protein